MLVQRVTQSVYKQISRCLQLIVAVYCKAYKRNRI